MVFDMGWVMFVVVEEVVDDGEYQGWFEYDQFGIMQGFEVDQVQIGWYVE